LGGFTLGLNRGFTYREKIVAAGGGISLLDHLASRYGHTCKGGWRERIEAGWVLVDGVACRPEAVLRCGQEVVWARPPWEEPEVPLFYAVLHEDGALLAVAKPSGLPTLPGGGFLENTLLSLVRRRYPEASPMHRLGRGTSGVVLFVRTSEAGKDVSRAWRERRVTKVYRALVEGIPERDSFSVEAPIGPAPHPLLGFVHAADPSGKPSRSVVAVLDRRRDMSLVEVTIETGRPHQIRIHMAACGHPLVGDPLYAVGGGFQEGVLALPGDGGYLLHAMRLILPHPVTGSFLDVECAPPLSLRVHP
jgi:23S rRNA pseudouridine1911/1915/1917 synthase